MYKIYLKEWLFLVVFWIGLTLCFSWINITSMNMFLDITSSWHLIKEVGIIKYLYSDLQYLESALFGFIFGSGFTLIDLLTDRSFIRRKSIGFIVLVKSFFYLLSLVLTSLLIYIIYVVFDILPEDVDYSLVSKLITTDFALSMALFLTGLILLTNFFIQIARKLGPTNMISLVTGKYTKPREEKLVVLFLDLKGSTTIAEELGHKKYSLLLQKCYSDLSKQISKFKAHVYQYVGDEVVLMWKAKHGLKKLNCINLFFEYTDQLEKNRSKYLKEFGVCPIFKAGMDMGCVTVVEVGEIRREIALHGDIINTASRIQHFCNKLNHRLLISERLAKALPYTFGFEKELIQDVQLKGKVEAINIYRIDKLRNIKNLPIA